MNRKIVISGVVIVLFISVIVAIRYFHKPDVAYIHNEGKIHGTYYTATYQQPDGIDLQAKLEERMREFELSLSTFKPNSVISRINRNDSSVRTDFYFETVYHKAREVSIKTNGAFDITVAPLGNAWGFGFGNADRTKAPNVQEILPYIGFEKIRLENHQLIKDDARIMLDASAIAKGYSSDIMAQLLVENGCENYMIEIGGEIACKGLNPKGQKWKIGIDKPIDDPSSVTNELQTIISISNVGLATSGNYRQFYYQDGKKYAHTIDPRSGYPVNHNLLSVSVIAPTCMQADAYATAFMVLGMDSSLQICNSIPDMECYLIYAGENGENKIKYTEGFKKYLTQ
jgi:thiamine biosynthesis lipoprotein